MPQARPFDLDADNVRRQQIEDDQKTVLAELTIRPRVDVPEEIEKLEWAKTLPKPWPRCKYR